MTSATSLDSFFLAPSFFQDPPSEILFHLFLQKVSCTPLTTETWHAETCTTYHRLTPPPVPFPSEDAHTPANPNGQDRAGACRTSLSDSPLWKCAPCPPLQSTAPGSLSCARLQILNGPGTASAGLILFPLFLSPPTDWFSLPVVLTYHFFFSSFVSRQVTPFFDRHSPLLSFKPSLHPPLKISTQ